MKKIILILKIITAIFILSCSPEIYTQSGGKGDNIIMTKIKITFNDNIVTGDIYDNETARNIINLLPLTLSFDDYNNIEKVSELPRKISTRGDGYSHSFLAGDIGYYAPWNNLVLYYGDFNYSGDGIIKIGRLNSGHEKLKAMKGKINIKIEKLD